jgi:hypothetical protein
MLLAGRRKALQWAFSVFAGARSRAGRRRLFSPREGPTRLESVTPGGQGGKCLEGAGYGGGSAKTLGADTCSSRWFAAAKGTRAQPHICGFPDRYAADSVRRCLYRHERVVAGVARDRVSCCHSVVTPSVLGVETVFPYLGA